MNAPQSAARAADRAGRSAYLEHLARVGLIAYGLVHVLIGWLALQLAWGDGSESADQSGALDTLSQTPVGGPLLWVLGVGLFALAAWQAAEVLRWRHTWSASGDRRKKGLLRSARSLAKAVIYAALGVLCLREANGTGRQSSGSEERATQGVLALPGGPFLVGAAALVVVVVAIHHVHRGLTEKFLEQIDLGGCSPSARRFVTRVGRIGYPAKGIALLVVGGLLLWAALTFDPDKAGGLDEALQTVREAPLGSWLLTLIAVGLAAYGLFCFARARYPERA